jgi:2-polyprenyl-3-methyl-5-hydroxy-6-metoxy-1,4-benzoquinol methylase
MESATFPAIVVLYFGAIFISSISVLTFSVTARSRIFAALWQLGGEARCDEALKSRKEQLFAEQDAVLKGKVLDIGTGAGAQLTYIATMPDVTYIQCVEPNVAFKDALEKRVDILMAKRRSIIGAAPLQISTFYGTIEEFIEKQQKNSTFDVVTCLLVLCSVANPGDVVKKLHDHCLRRGGSMIFCEHVAPKEGTFWWNLFRSVQPAWNLIGDGCQLCRRTPQTVVSCADWEKVEWDPYISPKLSIPVPWVFGAAKKR